MVLKSSILLSFHGRKFAEGFPLPPAWPFFLPGFFTRRVGVGSLPVAASSLAWGPWLPLRLTCRKLWGQGQDGPQDGQQTGT